MQFVKKVCALIMPLLFKLRREYIGHDVIAVDLALQRAAPLEIGEYYGKYNVVVEQTLEGAQNLVLYRNEQVVIWLCHCFAVLERFSEIYWIKNIKQLSCSLLKLKNAAWSICFPAKNL